VDHPKPAHGAFSIRRIGFAKRAVTSEITHVDIDFQGHGIGKLLVPLVIRPQARREMPANVKRLKHLVENRTRERSAD
jgi:hypothetical protein